MTKNNEQIIIDGVDVRKCYHISKEQDEYKCKMYYNENCDCDIRTDCYYKQLKRKEQVCEELEEEFKLLQQSKYVDSFRVIELSTENVKLKHQRDLYKQSHKTEQDRRRVFEQTLEKIREIAERGLNCSQCSCGAKADLYLVLQKINEVEDDLV